MRDPGTNMDVLRTLKLRGRQAAPLAPATRRVAPATVEPESHLTLPPTWCVSCRGVRTAASIVVRGGVKVRVSGPGAKPGFFVTRVGTNL